MQKALPAIVFVLLAIGVSAAETQQNLLDIYRLALTSDPTLASAHSANTATQEKVVQGKALLLPSVSLNASGSRSYTDIQYRGGASFFSAGAETFNTIGYSLNVSQPLFRKQNSVQYEQSKIQVTQADKQLQAAQQDLILRVAQVYFDVLLAQDKIDLINAQKAAISKQLEQAKVNFEVGSATITDVDESQARYDLTLAQEIAAINDLEVKKRTIQSIIGQLPQRLATARADLKASIPEPGEMEKWVEMAEQNNLALIIQQRTYDLASQEVERANAGHLPTLDAVGSYADSRANGGMNGFGANTQNTTIGLQLEIPLYQGGAISSKAREAVANKQKAQDDVEIARRQADLDARQAFLNVSSAVAQVQAYEQALKSSQSQLDSTSLGYEVGVRTSVDVLNAQQQFYSAKRDLLQSRYGYLLSILKLKSVAGILTEADLGDINRLLVSS